MSPFSPYVQFISQLDQLVRQPKDIGRVEFHGALEQAAKMFPGGPVVLQRHLAVTFHVSLPTVGRWISKQDSPDQAKFKSILKAVGDEMWRLRP